MKCFYHSADLDGHCSGAIVNNMFFDCQMIGINYGDPFPFDSIEQGEEVYMVDFCLQPFSDMVKLNELCNLHWIDHHKTAIDEAHKQGFIANGGQFLEIGKAGCELTWEYIYPESILPRSVYLLGRYDVWDHVADESVLPFQYGMRQYPVTLPSNRELWDTLFNSILLIADIVSVGRTILSYESNQNKKFCQAYSFETEFGGHKAICANRGFTNSQLFDSVYDESKHDLMITFIRKHKAGSWIVSLYSTKESIDCGALAKDHGGGGHKGAAGFQCKEIPFRV